MKPIIIILAAILFTSCTQKENTEETAATTVGETTVTLNSAQMKNAGIATGKMQQQSVSSILKVNGKIDVPPQNMVSISVPMGGYLKTTKLLPGLHVNKGEVIAVMEDQQYIQLQQDYLTAKVKAGLLENEYLRQRELNSSKAGSDKIFQQAEAEYASQKILVSSLSEKLKLAGININNIGVSNISRSVNIYSPINGFVSKVNVNIGKYVSPTEVLFELINPTDIHLALTVFEKDLNKLFIGQKLIAYTNNEPTKKHPCEILLIGKDLNPERNTEVHCHFEDYDKTLIPGTYMNAEIEVKSSKSFVLPEDAVVSFQNKQYAFIAKADSIFEMIEVQTGNSENGFAEILQAAALANQTFVIKGAYPLLMSLKNKSED
ncbi:efflux RND transporter periplasmic adaptor subunit [soil metagenome]